MGIFDFIFGKSDTVNIEGEIANGALLVDVRTPEEYKGGSVKGAKNIPLHILEENLSKLDKDKHFVLFCRSGNRSGMAKSLMEKHGFQHVFNGGSVGQVKSYIK